MPLVRDHEVSDGDRRGWGAEEEARADRSRWHGWDAESARAPLYSRGRTTAVVRLALPAEFQVERPDQTQ